MNAGEQPETEQPETEKVSLPKRATNATWRFCTDHPVVVGTAALLMVVVPLPLSLILDTMRTVPDGRNVADFYDAFWPELAATTLGLMLGIPAALAVERRTQAERQQQEADAAADRVVVLLGLIDEALLDSERALDRILDQLLSHRVGEGISFAHDAVWSAVGREFSTLTGDPELAAELAKFFTDMNIIGRRYESMVELGAVAPSASDFVRGELGNAVEERLQTRRDLSEKVAQALGKDTARSILSRLYGGLTYRDPMASVMQRLFGDGRER